MCLEVAFKTGKSLRRSDGLYMYRHIIYCITLWPPATCAVMLLVVMCGTLPNDFKCSLKYNSCSIALTSFSLVFYHIYIIMYGQV